MWGSRDGKAYRDFPTCIVFCTLRVILKGPAAGEAAMEERIAASPAACFLHAARDPEGPARRPMWTSGAEEVLRLLGVHLLSARFA